MADKYVMIGLGSGANDGTSWADAYQAVAGWQTALDNMAAGETCHVASVNDASVTLAAALDVDVASGAEGSRIYMVGYAYDGGSPTEDGTRVVVDGDSAAANCLVGDNEDYWTIRNFEFINSTGDAVSGPNSPYFWIWINCQANNAGGDGWGQSFYSGQWVDCHTASNANHGWDEQYYGALIFCSAINNTQNGIRCSYSACICCLAAGNASTALRPTVGSSVFFGCVSDCNRYGVYCLANAVIVGCRLTNTEVTALAGDGAASLLDLWNFYRYNATLEAGATVDHTYDGTDTRATTGLVGYNDVVYTMDFDNGVGATPFAVGETITGTMFEDGEGLTGGTSGKTGDVDDFPTISGTPDCRLRLGAGSFRTPLDLNQGLKVAINRGLPNVPIIGAR